MPKLHGVNLSPFVRKTRAVLAEKGIDYEHEQVFPFGPRDEYRKISPLGKVPCYQDEGVNIPDSSVIALYLEKKHPEPSLYPADPGEFARALWYEEYADTALTNALTTVFFQRFVRPNFFKEEPDADVVQKALEEEIPSVLDYLEGEIGDKEVIAGSHITVADLAIASPFVNYRHAGEEVDASRWPRVAAYVGRIHARPSYKGIIEAEFASD